MSLGNLTLSLGDRLDFYSPINLIKYNFKELYSMMSTFDPFINSSYQYDFLADPPVES